MNFNYLKHEKLILFFAFAVTAVTLNAQTKAVKLNPLSLFVATGNVAFETKVSENTSFQLGGFYSGFKTGDFKYAGWGLTPEYRIYFAGDKQALNGVYAGPFARYQNYSIKDKSTDDKAFFSSIGGGAVIGWQKAYSSGFVLDLFVGPAFYSGKFKDSSDEDDFDLSFGMDGFAMRVGLTIGFSF